MGDEGVDRKEEDEDEFVRVSRTLRVRANAFTPLLFILTPGADPLEYE